jgi:23S rRNA pseudouridine1911/1915/1917 synthase
MKIPQIDILYEDAHIVAVNKPAGLVVHPDGKTKGPFLTDWVLKHYPKAAKVGEPIESTAHGIIERPGIVHRLDRDTSGVMLIAKTKAAHAHLKDQFQQHTIQKKYYTFVYGEMTEEWGSIKRTIGRSPSDFRKWSATRGARGELRPSETWWTLVKSTTDLDGTGKYSLLSVEPKTGRTHQIRVHFKAINHPVVHDGLYAREKLTDTGPLATPLGFKRTALHAYSIAFKTVGTPKKPGVVKTVIAPLPADFKKGMEELSIDPKTIPGLQVA